jgi:intracellular sulfur oxidation DsrE/DsrF family protein
MNRRIFAATSLLCVILLASVATASADESDIAHKIVIQVSSADEAARNSALSNAANMQKAYGADNVHIVIVAYGPGLNLLTQESPHATKIESLIKQDIEVNACGNTINKITRESGKAPVLISGVEIVPTGVGRIVELQEHGYAYIRP